MCLLKFVQLVNIIQNSMFGASQYVDATPGQYETLKDEQQKLLKCDDI